MADSNHVNAPLPDVASVTRPSQRRFSVTWPSWLVLMAIVFVAPIQPGGDPALADSFVWTVLPQKIGSLLGAGLLCGIASFIAWSFSRKSQIVATMVFCLVGVIAIMGLMSQRTDLSSHDRTLATALQSYTYKPSGSEYSVVFDAIPSKNELNIPFEDGVIRGETAELILGTFDLYRVEFLPFPQVILEEYDEQLAHEQLREFAAQSGIQATSFEYEQNEMGRVAKLRGIKQLGGDRGESRTVTYVVHAYYGSSSAIVLYVGAPADAYPTPAATRFLRSVKRNPLPQPNQSK